MDKNNRIPERDKKIDTSQNGEYDSYVSAQKEREKKLCRLVINQRITILVPEGKNNEQYRHKWMVRMGLIPGEKVVKEKKEKKGKGPKLAHITAEVIHKLKNEGMTIQQIAVQLGCSEQVIYKRLQREREAAENSED